MHHPAELALHQYMEDAVKGKTEMSEEVIEQLSFHVWLSMLGRTPFL